MKNKRRDLLIDGLCLGGIFLWLVVYSYPYFFHSLSQNYRQIETYNLDSMVMLRAVNEALSDRWLQLHFVEYGHFYFNISMLTARLCMMFAPLGDWGVFFILRLFSLLGGLATIGITFLFARRYLGRATAVFAAVILAFSPRFVEFSNEVKPDTWQVFFIMLSLYFLARAFETGPRPEPRRRGRPASFGFVLAASAAAGAAFGTKYQGILLAPLLAAAALMVPSSQVGPRLFAISLRLLQIAALPLAAGFFWLGRTAYPLHVMLFLDPTGSGVATPGLYWLIQGARLCAYLAGILCLAVAFAFVAGFDFARLRRPLSIALIWFAVPAAFALCFAVSSPWLIYRLQFIPNLYQRSDIVAAGAWYGFRWLRMIFGLGQLYPAVFLSNVIGALSAAGAVWLVVMAARRPGARPVLPFVFVLIFTLIFLTVLVVKVNFVTSLYPLQIIPSLILLAAFGAHEIFAALPRWLGRGAPLAMTLTAVLLAAIQIWQGGGQLLQYPMLVTALSPANQKLGDWLDRCVPSDTRVLAAGYSYVPPRIAVMAVNWGSDYRYLVGNHPDLITINLDDAAQTERLAAQAGHRRSQSDAFYDAVLRSGEWQAGPVFSPFQIYVKKSAAIKPNCR